MGGVVFELCGEKVVVLFSAPEEHAVVCAYVRNGDVAADREFRSSVGVVCAWCETWLSIDELSELPAIGQLRPEELFISRVLSTDTEHRASGIEAKPGYHSTIHDKLLRAKYVFQQGRK